MAKFLTVNEAAQLVGKSPSSIRRIIHPIRDNNRHPDRHHIEPDAATAKALRLKGENFAWKISQELLEREVPADSQRGTSDTKAGPRGNDDPSDSVLVAILRKQLDIKDKQIDSLIDTNKALTDRLREGNILMGKLQQQLPAPKPVNNGSIDAIATDAPSPLPNKENSEPIVASGGSKNVIAAEVSSPKPEKESADTTTPSTKTPWYRRKFF